MEKFGLICNQTGLNLFNQGKHERGSRLQFQKLFTVPQFDDVVSINIFLKMALKERVRNVMITMSSRDLICLDEIILEKSNFNKFFIIFLNPVPADVESKCSSTQICYFNSRKTLRSSRDHAQYRLFIHWKINSTFLGSNDQIDHLKRRVSQLLNSGRSLEIQELMFCFNNLKLNI